MMSRSEDEFAVSYNDRFQVRIPPKSADTKGVIDITKGVSINDSYMVVSEGDGVSFGECNLYENDFTMRQTWRALKDGQDTITIKLDLGSLLNGGEEDSRASEASDQISSIIKPLLTENPNDDLDLTAQFTFTKIEP